MPSIVRCIEAGGAMGWAAGWAGGCGCCATGAGPAMPSMVFLPTFAAGAGAGWGAIPVIGMPSMVRDPTGCLCTLGGGATGATGPPGNPIIVCLPTGTRG